MDIIAENKVTLHTLKNETNARNFYFRRLISLVANVFTWENLPDEIPAEYVELTLLMNGFVAFTELGGKRLALRVSPTNYPNEYYFNDSYLYANPYIENAEKSGTVTDGENAIIMYNDNLSRWFGLTARDLISEYAELLGAVDVSLKIAIKNTRLTHIGKVTNSAELESYNALIRKISDGDLAVGVLSDGLVTEGISTLQTTHQGVDYLRQIAETREYLYNSFLSQFGIHANTAQKRERLLTDEIDMQNERPIFSISEMYAERVKAVERINKMWGTDISVTLNPALNGEAGEKESENDVDGNGENPDVSGDIQRGEHDTDGKPKRDNKLSDDGDGGDSDDSRN